MKKTLLLIYTFAFQFFAFSQEQRRITVVPNHPSKEIIIYTPQQEYDLSRQVPQNIVLTPTLSTSTTSLYDRSNPSLSAEGSAAVRFKDVPVNLATGAMSLPIPIYTLSEGLLSVPISLDYNGSGMKNQEVASWCGANWSLNAGGMITRMVRSLPDEGVKNGTNNLRGYFKFGFNGNGSSVDFDTEPDIFYLNIKGATYKMMYRHEGGNSKFEFFPEADITVLPTFQFLSGNSTVGKFVKFEVIMPDGVHYIFGDYAIEQTAEEEAGEIQSAGKYPGTSGFTNFWKNNAQTSVWYLTQIVSPYGQVINFEYDPVRYSFYRIAEHGVDISEATNAVCPNATQVSKKINRVFVNAVSLAKIRGINTRIEINQRTKVCTPQYDETTGETSVICEYVDLSNPRIDIDQWQRYPQNNSNAKRLNEILVMENTEIPKDTLFYKFNYGHFFGVNNDLPAGYVENNPNQVRVGFTHQRRLKLEKIDFPDKTNVKFNYKGGDPGWNGKSRLDYGIDHWGYANGYTGNSTVTGLIPRDSDYPNCTAATSNRESDPDFGFYGSLDSVIFSNRKTLAFEYEIHTAKNYKDALGNPKPIGGPRIKSVSNKDLISGIETKKVYDYTVNGQTTGHLAIKPTYRYKTPFQEIGTNSSIYERILGEMGRPPIVYSRVTERIINTSNQGLGKTVYYFDNDTTALTTYEKQIINCTGTYPNQVCDTVEYIRPEKVHPSSISGSWDHKYQTGNLIKTEVFNEAGDTLSVQAWQYTPQPIWNERQTSAAKVFKVNNRNIGYTTCCGGLFTQNYSNLFSKFRLKSQSSKTYSQSGTSPIESVVNYIYKEEMPFDYQQKYKGKHNQLVKTETIDSKGNFSEQYIKYPSDFEFADDTIHYEQTCYDEIGSYDCSYDEYFAHVPQQGSQARGIFEFKFANIFEFPLETNAKLNSLNLGASYTVIAAFTKQSGGFNFAPSQTFSSGNIGSNFTDIEYFKTPNDTITREPSYFLNTTALAFNDFGLPSTTKPFGSAIGQQNYDASKLLIANQIYNVGGVIKDSTSMFYQKKLFGANRTIGINKMESIIVFDSTSKKGAVKQKLDKDNYLLAQIDYLEPYESFSEGAVSLDNSKYRTVSRMPRIATSSLPVFGDSLDVDVSYSGADGRTLQNKSLRASPSRKDMLGTTIVFDSFGRPQKSILPVNTQNANGSFETNILTKAQSAYNDTEPISEITQYESSPFSRSFKTIGPGAAFRPSKEGIQTFETGNFGIQKRTVSNAHVLGIVTFSGNQIAKSTSTDENGNKTISFSDKEGRTLETWIQVSGDGSQASHYLITTYLFDYLNRPIAVIPPNLFGQIPDGTNLLSSPFLNLLHYTIYDSRGRVVEKHTPDAGWTYVVYNRLGQVVLSQNARHRAGDASQTNLWLWSKYGARGQNIMSGTLTQSTYSRSQLQTLFDDFTEEKQFEERSTTSANELHTNRSFPSVIQAFIGANDIKTVNYFDDYAWNTNSQLNFIKYKTDRWTNTKGLLTGTKVRRLDTNAWLTSAMYYDDKNRLIQTQSQNRFGSINQTDMVLDFIGQLIENRVIYRKPSNLMLIIATKYNYDHAGRKLDAIHYFNGHQELLATFDYDELGRLVSKNLNEARIDSIKRQNPVNDTYVADVAKRFVLLQPGTLISGDSVYAAFTASGLQKVSYQYDVRGNLRCVNCKTNGSLDSAKVFAMRLDYFQDGRFYNGLLSKQTWLADSTQKIYLYDYDKANRYLTANYTGIGNEKFDENSEYDANGNILKLNRFGKTGTTSYARIDSLNYSYPNNSNQLTGVTDLANATKGHKDNGNSTDYTYYPDGSLKTDNNKGITDITYNYLGLPEEVKFGSTIKIKNLYTADGQKLAQLLIEGTDTTRTDYVGDLIYRNGDLETVWTDEGRIKIKVDTTIYSWLDTLTSIVQYDTLINFKSRYQYFIQDHLGNNRVIFEKLNDSLYVAQRMDYYPFGSPFEADSLDFRFLYQGKEYVTDFGYNNYDFHSRSYDPCTGRFNQIDGANQFASGYTGMGNNPVSGIDPDGQWVNFAIGAALGGFSGWQIGKSQGAKGWGMAGYIFGGAVIGTLTAGISSGVAAATASWGTVGSGIASGAVGGFVGGTFNSALAGNSNPFQSGLKGALIGGAIGGAVGFGKLLASPKVSYTYGSEMDDVNSTGGSGVNPTDSDLSSYTKKQFGSNFKSDLKITNYSTEKIAPSSLSKLNYDASSGSYYEIGDVTKNPIFGVTIRRGLSRFSDVYISKAAFGGEFSLFGTVGHELIHAYQNSMGLTALMLKEAAAYKWNLDVLKANNYSPTQIQGYMNNLSTLNLPKNIPSAYKYNNIPNFPLIPKR